MGRAGRGAHEMKSPFSQRKTGALDWFCLGAIAFYQRYLSPRKGYRCAHARLHGGDGCSGFAREAIAQLGVSAAIAPIRARFAMCKLAGQMLRARKSRAQIELDKPNQPGDWNETGRDQNERERAEREKRGWRDRFDDVCCVDLGWMLCADSLCDGSACEAISCADASCAHGAIADASCADASCADASCADASCADASCADASCADASCAEAACGCHSCL